jgi:hypothetical protein
MDEEQKIEELIEGTHQLMEADYPSYNRITSNEIARIFIQATHVEKEFIVPFEMAWKWVGYSRKDAAKRKLVSKFVQNTDYSVAVKAAPQQSGAGVTARKLGGSGQNKETIMLTGHAFCEFAMQADTVQGHMCRKFAIEMIRGIDNLKKAVKSGEVEIRRVELHSDQAKKRQKTCESTKNLMAAMKDVGAAGCDYAKVNGTTNKMVTGFTKGEYAKSIKKPAKKVNLRDEMAPMQLAAAELAEMLTTKGIKNGDYQGNPVQYHESICSSLFPQMIRKSLHEEKLGVNGTKLTDIRKEQKKLKDK